MISRTLHKSASSTLTVFAFDTEQELSEHTAPFDAYVQVLDGEATLTIGGEVMEVREGEMVLMPANVPHALRANRRFKMLLIMFKETAG